MKISDELREFVMSEDLGAYHIAELRRIADRIDAETVELPKDANGEPIHAGSELFEPDGTRWEVLRIEYCSDGVDIVPTTGRAQLVLEPQDYRTMAHERQDSWERIADELDEMADAARSADDGCERLAGLAERIRRLANESGHE